MPDQPGVWRRFGDRLTKPAKQLDADALKRETTSRGAAQIDSLVDRQVATVTGAVRCVTLRPKSKVPALVVELFDGSRPLTLIWLGRRQIRGIEPGTRLQAQGRVTFREGRPVMFNPSYELLPRQEEGS